MMRLDYRTNVANKPMQGRAMEPLADELVPRGPRRPVELLEQRPWVGTQKVKGMSAGPIIFNGEHGVTSTELDNFAKVDEPAFDRNASVGVKASMRFGVCRQLLPQTPRTYC